MLNNNNQLSIDLLQDAKYKSFIDEWAKRTNAIAHLPISEQRKVIAQLMLARNKNAEQVHRVENVQIKGKDGNAIPLRIYNPSSSLNLPVLLYFHGGGWVYGSIEESDAVCRRFANLLSCVVVSVEYRLAPEFSFPKPLQDCYVATEWVAENVHLFNGDKNNITIGGESAGGNLAAAVALMARDKQGPQLSAQLLLNPAITHVINGEFFDKCPDQHFLTKDKMKMFWDMYCPSLEKKQNPYASLDCSSDFNNLPPALIVTGECDPLYDDINRYAMLLQQADVPVTHKLLPKVIHGFIQINLYGVQQHIEWTKEIGRLLSELGGLK